MEEAESALTGHISIEDVRVHNDDGADITLRRMVFTNNRNLIQSEAILSPAGNIAQLSPEPTAKTANGQQANVAPDIPVGKKGKGKAKASKQKAKSATEGQSSPSNKGHQPLVVDHSQLACDYHKGIVTGLSLVQPHLSACSQISRLAAPTHPASSSGAQQELHGNSQQESQQHQYQQQQQQQAEVKSPAREQSQQQQYSCPEAQGSGKGRGRPQAMVVGLGGGALPAFLSRHCHMDVQSVELDPVVADLARRHFGFADSATLQVKPLTRCCAVLCCAVLCCAVLCCAVLCCAVLCCAVLCCAVLCCAVLCCAVLCCAVLCCADVLCLPHSCFSCINMHQDNQQHTG